MGTIPPIISLTDPRNLLTLVLFTSLLSMGCYAMSCRDGHHRKLMFGLCLMIIPFIPASNLFFPVGFVIAERVLYIPSMGFCMLVAYGAWILISNLQLPILKTFILYLILIHGMKTVVRNRDWYDSYTLFSSAIQTLPTNGKMWSNLAVEAKDLGNLSHSELYFRQALTIEPNFTTGYMNLAYLLKYENRTEEAIEVSKLSGYSRCISVYYHIYQLSIFTVFQYTTIPDKYNYYSMHVSILTYQLSILCYLFSILTYQLSILVYLLSILFYLLSIPACQLSILVYLLSILTQYI